LVSISDVAEKANVSVSTVSLVLNGKAEDMRISQETCDRVWRASLELGYIPNLAAKKLSTGKGSRLPEVAFFWNLVHSSSFMITFFSEAQDLFDEGKTREMRFVIEPFREGQLSCVEDLLTGGQYHGIVVPPVCEEDIEYINSLELRSPTLLLFGESDKHSTVAVDNIRAGRKAAEIFAASGKKKVAIINHRNSEKEINVKCRTVGFMEACAELGMSAEIFEVLQKQIRGVSSIKTIILLGEAAAEDFLRRRRLPEAVFIQNDILAAGFMNAIIEAGVRVPEDLEIITFGDDILLETCRPTLTSIQFPTARIAREAIMILSDILVNPLAPPVKKLIEPPVVFRDSCPKPGGYEDN
jgi:DNA-binding LacI/PurR family transcriptional regulator